MKACAGAVGPGVWVGQPGAGAVAAGAGRAVGPRPDELGGTLGERVAGQVDGAAGGFGMEQVRLRGSEGVRCVAGGGRRGMREHLSPALGHGAPLAGS